MPTESDESASPPPDDQPVYHRLESPTQTPADATVQVASRHIWGKAARWSTIPTVKAYRGALPPGAAGIEFTTEVPETEGVGTPSTALWYRGSPGVRDLSDDWVYIPVRIRRKVP